MLSNAKIGLLPLYIKLYDEVSPGTRAGVEAFLHEAEAELRKRGIEVMTAPVCRVREEFANAVNGFEAAGADAMVTLHLAYSPSLESIDAVAASKLPVIVFDTTLAYEFSPAQTQDAIMYNHGIHGAQDFCNMLIRRGKPFMIEAGHLYNSDVTDRVAALAKGCAAASAMRGQRVGLIGKPFAGMGDFQAPVSVLRERIGMEVVPYNETALRSCYDGVTNEAVTAEVQRDTDEFDTRDLDGGVHAETARACLAVRRYVDEMRLTAFSVNFQDITKDSPIKRMPFTEACRAMARGIGYAGEGDALTAAFTGALLTQFPETSFSEMFCPDWKNNALFLSHMGEMNLKLAAKRPLMTEMDFIYTSADNPAVIYAMFKGGEAVLANLAPGPNDSFSLICAKGRMLTGSGEDNMPRAIRGWFEPDMPVHEFLKQYSMAGETHHIAIIYGDIRKALESFSKVMGWKYVSL